MAYDVLVVYAALAVWAGLLVMGFSKQNFRPFLGFGLVIALALNVRYFIEGPPAAIAFFVGIYDVFDNIGLGSNEGAPALASCLDNACTVWGDRYQQHPSWGVAFYNRFANGSALRSNILLAHIGLNSVALVLMHLQILKPGTGSNKNRHRLLGRVSFGALTLGTIFAVWLASEHGSVTEYGGIWSQLGFYSMSVFVYGTAVQGIRTARAGDMAGHRRWMIRAAGAMWGAFWLFRVMLVITGPLLRNYESASLLLSIWLSAPLGIVIAEIFQVRSARSSRADRTAVASPVTA